jgi:hypothetical protein
MIQTDREGFYKTWVAAWEQCGHAVTERMLLFAFECLQQFELVDIQRAVLQHATNPDTGQFPPKTADIIRQIEGGSNERAVEAWTKLERAVTQVGPWKPIVFDDARIHAAIEEMGGLTVFCRATLDEWNILRSWFLKSYQALLRQSLTRYPAIIWAEGGRRSELVFIGDETKARQVLSGGGETIRITADLGPKALSDTLGEVRLPA